MYSNRSWQTTETRNFFAWPTRRGRDSTNCGYRQFHNFGKGVEAFWRNTSNHPEMTKTSPAGTNPQHDYAVLDKYMKLFIAEANETYIEAKPLGQTNSPSMPFCTVPFSISTHPVIEPVDFVGARSESVGKLWAAGMLSTTYPHGSARTGP